MLNAPQSTLTVDEESPWPGGLAKGLWKARPVTPLTRCGIAFAKNTPPKKYERMKPFHSQVTLLVVFVILTTPSA